MRIILAERSYVIAEVRNGTFEMDLPPNLKNGIRAKTTSLESPVICNRVDDGIHRSLASKYLESTVTFLNVLMHAYLHAQNYISALALVKSDSDETQLVLCINFYS